VIPLSEPALQGHELEYVADSVRSTWISSNGEYITRFEQAIAEFVGVRHVVACNCGTSALHVSLILSGVNAVDEVLVPAVTFIAPVL
jgi:perosamine synthetase